jgi:hypothetical protein
MALEENGPFNVESTEIEAGTRRIPADVLGKKPKSRGVLGVISLGHRWEAAVVSARTGFQMRGNMRQERGHAHPGPWFF